MKRNPLGNQWDRHELKISRIFHDDGSSEYVVTHVRFPAYGGAPERVLVQVGIGGGWGKMPIQATNVAQTVANRMALEIVRADPNNQLWNFVTVYGEHGERALVYPGLGLPKYTPNPSVLDRAIRHYGLTENWPAAGYILPDGSMLDFGEGRGERSQDHRNVEFLMRARERESRGETMGRFMVLTGAIRFMPEAAYFDVRTDPTRDQIERMVEIAEDMGRAELDMHGPRRERFVRQYEDWELREVRRDIEAYWGS